MASSRGGGRRECSQEVGLGIFLNNSRAWVYLRVLAIPDKHRSVQKYKACQLLDYG